jgi:Ca2+-binding EF-hand superfamily protein
MVRQASKLGVKGGRVCEGLCEVADRSVGSHLIMLATSTPLTQRLGHDFRRKKIRLLDMLHGITGDSNSGLVRFNEFISCVASCNISLSPQAAAELKLHFGIGERIKYERAVRSMELLQVGEEEIVQIKKQRSGQTPHRPTSAVSRPNSSRNGSVSVMSGGLTPGGSVRSMHSFTQALERITTDDGLVRVSDVMVASRVMGIKKFGITESVMTDIINQLTPSGEEYVALLEVVNRISVVLENQTVPHEVVASSVQSTPRQFLQATPRYSGEISSQVTEALEMLKGKIYEQSYKLVKTFRSIDEDHNGLISRAEFARGLAVLNIFLPQEVEKAVVDVLFDGRDELDYKKFAIQLKMNDEVEDSAFIRKLEDKGRKPNAAPFGMAADIELTQAQNRTLLENKISRVAKCFEALDLQRTGRVDYKQFMTAIERLNLHIPKEEADVLFDSMDSNRTGLISYVDFIRQFVPEEHGKIPEILQPRSARSNGDILCWSTAARRPERQRLLYDPTHYSGVLNEAAPAKGARPPSSLATTRHLLVSRASMTPTTARSTPLSTSTVAEKKHENWVQKKNVVVRVNHPPLGSAPGHAPGDLPSDANPNHTYGAASGKLDSMRDILSNEYGRKSEELTVAKLEQAQRESKTHRRLPSTRNGTVRTARTTQSTRSHLVGLLRRSGTPRNNLPQ